MMFGVPETFRTPVSPSPGRTHLEQTPESCLEAKLSGQPGRCGVP